EEIPAEVSTAAEPEFEAPATPPPAPKAAAAAAHASGSGLFFHAAAQSPAPAEAPEFNIQPEAPAANSEVDLSSEWEGEFADESAAAIPAEVTPEAAPVQAAHEDNSQAITEVTEEIRFYLGHSMVEQAQDAMAKLEKLTNDRALLSNMRQEIAAAEQAQAAQP